MDKATFVLYLKRAKTFRKIDRGSAAHYWKGYRWGLHRLYYGERYGTTEQHQQFLDLQFSFDMKDREINRGYHDGLAGKAPVSWDHQ
jgi:hypothetical protein